MPIQKIITTDDGHDSDYIKVVKATDDYLTDTLSVAIHIYKDEAAYLAGKAEADRRTITIAGSAEAHLKGGATLLESAEQALLTDPDFAGGTIV